MSRKITARTIARAFHRKTYHGRPCSRGHCERYVTNKKCVICALEAINQWAKQDPKRKAAVEQRWRDNNRDRIKEKNIYNYALKGEEQRAKQKQKRDTDPVIIARREARQEFSKLLRDPEYIKARNRLKTRRRRLRKSAAIGSHTLMEELELLRTQDGLCAYCNVNMHGKYTVDHIIPLLHGGTDFIENIALACLSCNDSKGTKTLEDWQANGTRRRPAKA